MQSDYSNLAHSIAGHGAANVTLGIPRLREIVMTASRKPKTPSMSMVGRKGVSLKDIDTFCKRAGRLTLSQVVDKVTVKETLASSGSSRTKDFTIELSFYPRQDYLAEYDVEPFEILAAFGTKFPLILKKEIQNELKKFDQDMKSQMVDIGKGKMVRERVGETDVEAGGEDFEDGRTGRNGRDEDEASEVGDGDAAAAKRQRQSKEQATYEDDEDEDNTMDQYDDDAIEAAYASTAESDDEGMLKDDSVDVEDISGQVEVVEQTFMQNFSHTRAFSFRDSGCTIDLQVSTYA
jgi:hypothetical protein